MCIVRIGKTSSSSWESLNIGSLLFCFAAWHLSVFGFDWHLSLLYSVGFTLLLFTVLSSSVRKIETIDLLFFSKTNDNGETFRERVVYVPANQPKYPTQGHGYIVQEPNGRYWIVSLPFRFLKSQTSNEDLKIKEKARFYWRKTTNQWALILKKRLSSLLCLVKLICSLFVADDSAFVCQFSRFFLLPVADWLVAAAAAFALPWIEFLCSALLCQ